LNKRPSFVDQPSNVKERHAIKPGMVGTRFGYHQAGHRRWRLAIFRNLPLCESTHSFSTIAEPPHGFADISFRRNKVFSKQTQIARIVGTMVDRIADLSPQLVPFWLMQRLIWAGIPHRQSALPLR
jgi:hypothetical protein